MPVVAIVNRKGGSGKSTLAAHLAAAGALAGRRVMLGDVDRQQSAQAWLRLRAAQNLPPQSAIAGWTVDPKNVLRVPAGITHVVLDTPGGMRGFELARIVMNADAVLMPVCNSVFDRDSAAECFEELMSLPRVASGRCKVGAIGMRLDARTRAADVLAQWAAKLGLPFVGVLREAQVYVRCIEFGLTLFDLPEAQVRADLEQWRSILQWLDPILDPAPAAAPRATAPGAALDAPVVPDSLLRAPASTPAHRPTMLAHQTPAARTQVEPARAAAAPRAPYSAGVRPTPSVPSGSELTPRPPSPTPATLPQLPVSPAHAGRPSGSLSAGPVRGPAPSTRATMATRGDAEGSTDRPRGAQLLRPHTNGAGVRPMQTGASAVVATDTQPDPSAATASGRREAPRPAPAVPAPVARRAADGRIGRLLEALPIPRFLLRNS